MHRTATLLALDSATGACSAAVRAGGALVAHRFQPMARGQAEALMPMAAEVLAEAGLTATDLDGVAVTRGPGAFTGLRIGLSAARGLALAAGVPCLGVTTFQALAEAVPDAELAAGGVLLVAVETKRADLYVQPFALPDRTPLAPPAARPVDALDVPLGDRLLIVGDGAARAATALADRHPVLGTAPGLPDAAVVARLVERLWDPAAPAPEPPAPLYLRPPEVKPAAHGGRLRP